MKTFDEMGRAVKLIMDIVDLVDESWDELDEEAQECWENFRENIKELL